MNPQNNQNSNLAPQQPPMMPPTPQGAPMQAPQSQAFQSPQAPQVPQPSVQQTSQMPPANQPTIQAPMGMQPNPQTQFAQTNYGQQQFNQQQILQQQQTAAQTTSANMVGAQPLQGPQAVGSQDTTPQVTENPISTQSTLMISELRDGVVIMKDGSFRAVVACQSINFDLMSEQEREGVEYSYQNFLNSLNFTIQILVRSQRVDIGPYIERLATIRRNNDNMLLGILMDDYINFIDILSQEANIMDKSFFIVIPYYSTADAEAFVNQTKNLFKGFKKTPTVTRINRDTYNKAVDELNNRVETVVSGLFNIGIHSVRLNTRELAELYYNFNNPDTAVREPLVDFTKLATTYVKKREKPNEQEK